jgi:hypothetical protein
MTRASYGSCSSPGADSVATDTSSAFPAANASPATRPCSRPRYARHRKRSGSHAQRSTSSWRSHRSTPAPPASASTPTSLGYVPQRAGALRTARSPPLSRRGYARPPTHPCAANSCSPFRVGPSRVVSSASNSTTDTCSGAHPTAARAPPSADTARRVRSLELRYNRCHPYSLLRAQATAPRSRAELVVRASSVYGAERSQPVATGGKCDGHESGQTGENRCRGLRPARLQNCKRRGRRFDSVRGFGFLPA